MEEFNWEAEYRPKRNPWKSALGAIVRHIVGLLIITFFVFVCLTLAAESYVDCLSRSTDDMILVDEKVPRNP